MASVSLLHVDPLGGISVICSGFSGNWDEWGWSLLKLEGWLRVRVGSGFVGGGFTMGWSFGVVWMRCVRDGPSYVSLKILLLG